MIQAGFQMLVLHISFQYLQTIFLILKLTASHESFLFIGASHIFHLLLL